MKHTSRHHTNIADGRVERGVFATREMPLFVGTYEQEHGYDGGDDWILSIAVCVYLMHANFFKTLVYFYALSRSFLLRKSFVYLLSPTPCMHMTFVVSVFNAYFLRKSRLTWTKSSYHFFHVLYSLCFLKKFFHRTQISHLIVAQTNW